MYTVNDKTTFISIDDLCNDYSEFKGRRVSFYAKLKGVSLNHFKLIVDSVDGITLINIPKKYVDKLEELKTGIDLIDISLIVEGEPYFCAHREKVTIKQGEVLATSYC